MPTKTVDVRKAQMDLKELLSLTVGGTEVILTEDDTPIARLIPVGQRVPGLHSGEVWTSDDFDQPLGEDFWTGSP